MCGSEVAPNNHLYYLAQKQVVEVFFFVPEILVGSGVGDTLLWRRF